MRNSLTKIENFKRQEMAADIIVLPLTIGNGWSVFLIFLLECKIIL